MSYYVKRSEEYDGDIIEAYLTDEDTYGVDYEAKAFDTVEDAALAISEDKWDETGDYTYDIEKW